MLIEVFPHSFPPLTGCNHPHYSLCCAIATETVMAQSDSEWRKELRLWKQNQQFATQGDSTHPSRHHSLVFVFVPLVVCSSVPFAQAQFFLLDVPFLAGPSSLEKKMQKCIVICECKPCREFINISRCGVVCSGNELCLWLRRHALRAMTEEGQR